MGELINTLIAVLNDCKNMNPPKFIIIGYGNTTKAFYKGVNITEEVETLIYTHDCRNEDGATLTTYKSESVEYK